MAYQGYGHGLDREKIADLHRIVLGTLTPDLTIMLDLDPGIGLARTRSAEEAQRRGVEDRFERMEIAFHQRMRDGFRDIAAAEPQRVALIDAETDVDRVGEAIVGLVRERFGIPL